MTCQSGLVLQAEGALEHVRGPLDTLVVSGGHGHRSAAADAVLVAHVRRLARESRRVASVCTGTTILAAAGLLDGRHATTHWHFARRLARDYPDVLVDPDPIFIRDGAVSTAAGVTSALDLTLVHATAPPPQDTVVRDVVAHVTAHLDGGLSAARLAGSAGVSERHLTRLFLEQLHQIPGRFVRQARLEAAAHLLFPPSCRCRGSPRGAGSGPPRRCARPSGALWDVAVRLVQDPDARRGRH